jgi:hypothetical protein
VLGESKPVHHWLSRIIGLGRSTLLIEICAVLLAISSGLTVASQLVSSLGNPLIRWIACIFMLTLCTVGSLSPRMTEMVTDLNNEPYKLGYRLDGRFGFGALFLLCFLATDVFMYYQGYVTPLILWGPTIGGDISVSFPLKVGEELLRIPVKGIDTILTPTRPDDDVDRRNSTKWPFLEYELRKKDNVNELLLRDLHLTVIAYENKRPVYYHGIAPVVFTPEVVICFELSKKSESLPWIFKPTRVISGTESRPWSPSLLAFTDKATTRLKLIVQASDPGLYTFTLSSEFASDLDLRYRRELTNEPISFLYLTGSDLSNRPKVGEELLWIGPGGAARRETQPLPGAPLYPGSSTAPPNIN